VVAGVLGGAVDDEEGAAMDGAWWSVNDDVVGRSMGLVGGVGRGSEALGCGRLLWLVAATTMKAARTTADTSSQTRAFTRRV
jgi:hypothetical protein